MRIIQSATLLLFCSIAVPATAQPAPPPLVTTQEISQGLTADGSRWLTFGGDYTNQRHSPLTQITADNINRLVPLWTFQTGTLGNFETTSLLRDNVLYVTGPQNVAWAIDARTGRQIWRYRRELPSELTACCGLVNRGFAVLGDKLFMTTLDAHLLALDMKTGAIVWDATLDDYKAGHSATIAPLVVKDKVIVGAAGRNAAFAHSSTPTMRTPASGPGVSTPCRDPESPATRRGPVIRGRPAAPACG